MIIGYWYTKYKNKFILKGSESCKTVYFITAKKLWNDIKRNLYLFHKRFLKRIWERIKNGIF